MGGNNKETGMLKSCEVYDVKMDSWTRFADINNQKDKASSQILNYRFMYLFGGRNNDLKQIETIEKYDLLLKKPWDIIECKLKKSLINVSTICLSTK